MQLLINIATPYYAYNYDNITLSPDGRFYMLYQQE